MGGVDPARAYVERALDAKRSVVTANKMLLAMHGPALVDRAVAHGVDLAFEGVGRRRHPGHPRAARGARERLGHAAPGHRQRHVQLRPHADARATGSRSTTAIREAQAKGYAEADPTLDVDGHDAAHKLVVLAMLAFGARVEATRVPTEGIRGIDPIDHRFAERFGFVIKHLAIGRDHGDGVELRVHPALVPRDTPLANVTGVLNAIALEGRALGPCLLSGRGAGDLPTAVSVVADVLDVARALAQRRRRPRDARHPDARRARSRRSATSAARYYLRFQVHDRPGVLARLAGALGEAGVSIEQMVQEGGAGSSGVPVDIVMLTHEARERDVVRALDAIGRSDVAAAPPRLIRIFE